MQVSLSTQPKEIALPRIFAKMVDLLVVFALGGILPYPLGPMAGFLYSLVADGLKLGKVHGQSLGKKLFKLKVEEVHENEPRKPCSLRASCLRNAPVGVATFFGIIPFWGWIILGLLGIPLMAIEVYLMVRVDKGRRLGDVMGDTEVVPSLPS